MQNFILYRSVNTGKPLVFLHPFEINHAHIPTFQRVRICMTGTVEIAFDCNFKPQQEAFIQVGVNVKSCFGGKEVSQKDIAEVKKFVRNLIK